MKDVNGVSFSFGSYGKYSLKAALENAMAYKTGKDRLQLAIGAALYQTIQHGNPDWLTAIFAAAQLTEYKHGASVTNADGKVVYRYIVNSIFGGKDACLIKWDKDSRKFKMVEGWVLLKQRLDLDKVAETLRYVRWDRAEATKTETAFDMDKAVLRLIKSAFDPEKGNMTDINQLLDAVKAQHTAMLTGQIRKAS